MRPSSLVEKSESTGSPLIKNFDKQEEESDIPSISCVKVVDRVNIVDEGIKKVKVLESSPLQEKQFVGSSSPDNFDMDSNLQNSHSNI